MYLYRLGHADSDYYYCGLKETTKYLLLSCKELGEARRKAKDKLRMKISLTTLLHTKTGIKTTLDFLKETRIATRK